MRSRRILGHRYVDGHARKQTRQLLFWDLETDTLHTSLTRLTRSSLSTAITAFILSKVDYCNVALAGLPKCDLDRLQSVINAAAHLTCTLRLIRADSRPCCMIYFGSVFLNVTYKFCVLVYTFYLHGTAPWHI